MSLQLGHHRNLLVSATGTGKTVMAALDYARPAERLSRSKLLLIAHRKEILEKSRDTFRHCLRDPAFGELWVGGQRPVRFDHVVASIQSLTATGFEDVATDHFDVVIVDEFHHAAAKSYVELLQHIAPQELLADIVLSSIRRAIPSNWAAKSTELRAIAGTGKPVSLSTFLEESGLDLEDIYASR